MHKVYVQLLSNTLICTGAVIIIRISVIRINTIAFEFANVLFSVMIELA